MLALRLQDGVILWQSALGVALAQAVAFTPSAMILVAQNLATPVSEPQPDALLAVQLAHGSLLWRRQLCCDLNPPQIATHGGALYVQAITSQSSPAMSSVTAYNAASAATNWTWTSASANEAQIGHSLQYAQGVLLTNTADSVNNNQSHTIVGIDAGTGQPRWQITLAGTATTGSPDAGNLSATPLIAPGPSTFYASLTFATRENTFPALTNAVTEYSASDGKLLWQTPLQGNILTMIPVPTP